MWTLQSNFSKGEIDPQLASRSDTEIYYQGVKTARNVRLVPQGGLEVRPGMEYMATAVDGRLEPFTSSDNTNYVLLFDNQKVYVYKAGVLQTGINGTANDYFTIDHTTAQVADMDYVQAGDTFILTHEDVIITKVLWSSDTTWTVSTAESFITNMPQNYFADTYSPAGTSEVQTIAFTDAQEGDRFKLTVYGILTDEIAYAGVANTDERNGTARNMQEALQDHPLFKGKTVTVAWSAASTFTFTLDASLPYPIGLISVAAVYTRKSTFKANSTITTTGVSRAEDVWSDDLAYSITGATQANPCVITVTGHTFSNGDKITITGVGGMTQLNGNTYTVAGAAANTVQLSGVNSTAYTAYTSGGTATRHGRGWPRTVCFHEGRLYFGGSKEMQQTVWGSNVNDFFNFRTGRALPDNAVAFTINTDKVNKIQGMYSNTYLQIFTTDYEFYVPSSPVTPETVAAKVQTSNGSKRVRPINVDGVTVFVNKNGKAICGFEFINDLQGNRSVSISLLSPHLIKDPVKLSLCHGTSERDATYVWILNSDGTMTVMNSLALENISAFTRWETDGLIKSIASFCGELWFLVARTINSSTVYYLERANGDLALDSAKRQTGLASDTVSNLDHLEGETVKVRALTSADVSAGYEGGRTLPDEVVASGDIVLGGVYDTVEAGLDYDVEIQTMPLNVTNRLTGSTAFKKKRIMKCGLDLYESNGMVINGYEISTNVIGQSQFDPPIPYTGKKEVSLGGWSQDASVTITRGSPHRFQILGLGLEVKF